MTSSLSATAPVSTTLRRIGRGLMLGGSFWIAHYALQLVAGLSEGRAAPDSRRAGLDGFCFSAAIVTLGISLGSLALCPRTRTPFSVLGLLLAAMASSAMLVGFARVIFLGQPPGLWGGVGVVGSCLSATFAALTVKRSQALPSPWTTGLLLVGLLTFPLIVAFIWPGQFVPTFLTDELPFALSGAAYFGLGRALQKI